MARDTSRRRLKNDDDSGSQQSRSTGRERSSGGRSTGRERSSGGTRRTERTTGGRNRDRSLLQTGISQEVAIKQSQEQATERDFFLKEGTPFFTPDVGDHLIRILPATWENADRYTWTLYVHYNIGADNNSYACPKTYDKPCPICEERENAQRDDDDDYANELKPTRRDLIYVIDRDNERDGVQAYPAPYTLIRELFALSIDKRTKEVLQIINSESGYDFEFSKAGTTKFNTVYSGFRIDRDSSPIHSSTELMNEWIDYILNTPLPDVVILHEYDYIKDKFLGKAGKEEKEDESSNKDDDIPDSVAKTGLLSYEELTVMSWEKLDNIVIEYGLRNIDPEKYENIVDYSNDIADALGLN